MRQRLQPVYTLPEPGYSYQSTADQTDDRCAFPTEYCMDGGREGGRDGWREGGREGRREGRREIEFRKWALPHNNLILMTEREGGGD